MGFTHHLQSIKEGSVKDHIVGEAKILLAFDQRKRKKRKLCLRDRLK